MRVRDAIQAAGKCGYADAFAGARAGFARADALAGRPDGLHAEADKAYQDMVRRLVDGDPVDPDELTAVAYRTTVWHSEAPGRRMFAAAAAVVYRRAEAAAKDEALALFGRLQDVAGGIVKDSCRVADTLPAGVTDEQSARRAGVRTAWYELGELVERWDAVHALAGTLREAGLVAGMGLTADDRAALRDQRVNWAMWLRYEAPERLPDRLRVPAELLLNRAVRVGARPGLVDGAEAAARFVTWRRQHRPEMAPMVKVTTWNSHGSPLAVEDTAMVPYNPGPLQPAR